MLAFAFCGCTFDAGNYITKSYGLDGSYTKLEVEDAFTVTVSDTATQIYITAGENIMPKIIVLFDNNKLTIRMKRNINIGSHQMNVILPYNAKLTSVELSGSSDFISSLGLKGSKVEVDLSGSSDFACDIEADKLELDLSGSSNITGNIAATNLEIELSGASDATIQGQVSNLSVDLSGSSDIKRTTLNNTYGLVCNRCTGSLSGSSTTYIHCDGTIKVSLSGGSDLHYTGNASTSGSSTSGASDLIHDVL